MTSTGAPPLGEAFTDKAPQGSLDDRGRNGKAASLRELAAARFAVLIGAAGTGKTTLLKRSAPLRR